MNLFLRTSTFCFSSLFFVFKCLLLALLLSSCGADNSAVKGSDKAEEERKEKYREQKMAEALKQELESFPWEKAVPEAARNQQIDSTLQYFYQQQNYLPIWNTYKEGIQSRALLERLEKLSAEGLEPEDFPLKELRQQLEELYDQNGIDYQKIARLDLMLSANYLLLANQISTGRIEPGKYYQEWHIRPREPDLLENLRLASRKGVGGALNKLEPDYRQYDLLKEELQRYLQIAEQGGWQPVQLDEPLDPGEKSAQLPAILKRLAMETQLQDTSAKLYTEDLKPVIRELRYRYGLAGNTAQIDAELVEALNVPVEQRISQLNLNLERSRWLTEPMGERYLLVNLPEYQLRVVEEGEPVLAMKVVIGEVVNTTPIFSDSLEYLVFSPYWNVPEKIAREEILPKAKKDPGYLDRNHYQVVESWQKNAPVLDPYQIDWDSISIDDFPYRIRQEPGSWNSLGRVKFIFPNNKAIYLHDTPAKSLFDEYNRLFSHGCIRVEKPVQLADYLLSDLGQQEVKRLMHLDERKEVHLQEKVPVYLVYFTAVVDSDGKLRFLPDMYELDKVQQKALQSS